MKITIFLVAASLALAACQAEVPPIENSPVGACDSAEEAAVCPDENITYVPEPEFIDDNGV